MLKKFPQPFILKLPQNFDDTKYWKYFFSFNFKINCSLDEQPSLLDKILRNPSLPEELNGDTSKLVAAVVDILNWYNLKKDSFGHVSLDNQQPQISGNETFFQPNIGNQKVCRIIFLPRSQF